MVNRSSWTPRSSTIETAWSVLAQSMPAVAEVWGHRWSRGRAFARPVPGRSWMLCSSLLPQLMGTPNGSGHDCRSLTDRRSGGAQPCRQSACPGPLGLAELMQDLDGLADVAMTQREPGMRRRPCRHRHLQDAGSRHRQIDLHPVSGRRRSSRGRRRVTKSPCPSRLCARMAPAANVREWGSRGPRWIVIIDYGLRGPGHIRWRARRKELVMTWAVVLVVIALSGLLAWGFTRQRRHAGDLTLDEVKAQVHRRGDVGGPYEG
jgi:hypothetical protein